MKQLLMKFFHNYCMLQSKLKENMEIQKNQLAWPMFTFVSQKLQVLEDTSTYFRIAPT